MNDRVLDSVTSWIAKRGGNAKVWFQRLSMLGFKRGRTIYKDHEGPLAYFGFMFYFFAIFWNNVHPDTRYGGGEDIPWHGFTFYWGPSATGEPGAKLWKNKKELCLWRSSLRLSIRLAMHGLRSKLKGFGKTGPEK